MTRLPAVSALTAHSVGWAFFLCTDKSVRTGRGGDYLALTLADATGEVVARAFDNVDRLRESSTPASSSRCRAAPIFTTDASSSSSRTFAA